jgi:signal transduction histidine kinase
VAANGDTGTASSRGTSRWRVPLGLRLTLALSLIPLLVLPLIGLRMVEVMTELARNERLENLGLAARNLAASLHERPELFVAPNTGIRRQDKVRLLAVGLLADVAVDQRDVEWAGMPGRALTDRAHSDGSTGIRARLSAARAQESPRKLFLLVDADDERLVLPEVRDERTLAGDELILSVGQNADAMRDIRIQPVARPGGWRAELELDPEPALLRFRITDVDDPNTRELQGRLDSGLLAPSRPLGDAAPDDPRAPLWHSAMRSLARASGRVSVYDASGELLAQTGQLTAGDLPDRGWQTRVARNLLTWTNALRPALDVLRPAIEVLDSPPADDLAGGGKVEGQDESLSDSTAGADEEDLVAGPDHDPAEAASPGNAGGTALQGVDAGGVGTSAGPGAPAATAPSGTNGNARSGEQADEAMAASGRTNGAGGAASGADAAAGSAPAVTAEPAPSSAALAAAEAASSGIPALTRALTGLPAQAVERLTAASGLPAWLLSSAHPVWAGDRVVGALVIEENTASRLALGQLAIERLTLLTALALASSAAALLLIGSITVWRIVRLRRQAERAIDPRGRVVGQVRQGIIRDEIGALARSHSAVLERLRQHQQYLGNLRSRLVHELRTPIMVVRSSLDNLSAETDEARRTAYLERVQGGAQRLERILASMGEASSLESMLAQSELERIDLAALVKGCAEGYRSAFGVAVEVRMEAGDLRCAVVPEAIAQALDKLVSNAVDFAKPGTPILIVARRASERAPAWRLSVRNQGPALPATMRDSLFDSMVSVRDDAARSAAHLGMGLYLVRLVAEFHGGHAFARDVRDGVEVGFTIAANR